MNRASSLAGISAVLVAGAIAFASSGSADVNVNGCLIVTAPTAATHTVCVGASLVNTNLSNMNLTWAVLTNADLRGANLTGANLTGASIDGANLTGAMLTGSDLTWAYAHHANLSQVAFTNANLTSADLTKTTLTGASFTGATLTGATVSETLLARGADQTLAATSPTGRIVTWAASTALPGVILASCTYSSGSLFPIGVRAVSCAVKDAAGHSAAGVFSITIATIAPAPSAPVAAPGNGQASLQWIRPVDDGRTPLTGYVVTPSVAGIPQTPVLLASPATRQVVTGLTNGTTYTFTVAAQNAIGTGPPSVATAPITVGAPVAPTGVVGAPGNGQATVQWKTPSSNAASITGYAVTPFIAGVAQPVQTFSNPATTATLTGLTNGTPYTFSVSALATLGTGPVVPFAADTFTRAVANGWGTADTGGAWTPGTSSSGFQDTGTEGTVTIAAPNRGAHARLLGTSASDVDLQARFKADKIATGSGQWAAVVARRVANGDEYRVRARFRPDNLVGISVTEQVNGVATGIGTEVIVPGLVYAPNTYYDLRAQVVGTNPTVINARVWLDGQSEPTSWMWTRSDSTASLQTAGSVGVWTYLSNTSTNAPVTISVDDFVAQPLSAPLTAVSGAPSLPSAPIVIGTPVAPASVVATPAKLSATITWTAPVQTNGGPVTGYVVIPYWGQVALPAVTFASTATTQTITKLWNQKSFTFPMSTSYTFKVEAINSTGTGPPSAMSNAVTPT